MSGAGWKERLRAVPVQTRFLAALNAALVLIAAACALSLWWMGNSFETITAADRFRGGGETRFAQLACWMSVGQGKTEEDIRKLRSDLESKFVEQSLEAPEGGSLYIDAYSARTLVSAVTEHATAEVSAIAVGGEFFYFHPLTLRSGSYIAERDLMDDLVVLDEAMAWRLFGGTELAGMPLTINGKPFVVSGVVSLEDDFASRQARSGDGLIFLSYSALARLGIESAIDCYEIVMPDPISGYAMGIAEEMMSGADIVENSGRFTPERLLALLQSFGQRSMRTGAVIYPYWENALRLAEDHGALLMVLAVLTALCPVITLAVLLIGAVRSLWRFLLREVPRRIETSVERRREKQYAKLAAKDREGE